MILESHQSYILFAALFGFMIGILIAEFGFKKAAKHTNHVVPATIIKNSQHIIRQKVLYYGVLITFILATTILHVEIPEPCYTLVSFAIVGGDIQKLATKLFRLK